MSHSARLAREDAITEALRATNEAIGDDVPTSQALKIIDAIKRLRSDRPARVTALAAANFMARVQDAARAAWLEKHDPKDRSVRGPGYDATAGIETPIGRLSMVTWRRSWTGVRGERIAWAGEYYLNDEPITIAEIEAAGLAQRPTRRNRQRKVAA